ncbi:transporter substrate-binding domain-containing protein [Pantoea dispersa]|uniref:transporter substrate-binding domain-containing protein n=1 Tax=Pantoea dispersa TaxID=59814 RepID=UPI0021AF69CC|nr:transporter substrate-binding domain-containing protein [Pantoea dispersa]MCT6592518.1 transporter substrate-binding domain-containing protein [Pantoea dispersa]MCW0323467.1 hypothetical protein [Pantoea dispersa]MCW0328203.1 hypothetical protein [Pantoea dispersa]MCW0434598.1 hypothetical protein [Pantoea dispersa]
MESTLHIATALRFAVNLGNPVISSKDEQGNLSGISIALAYKISAELGKRAELVIYESAGGVVKDAASNKWDIAFLAIDPQRKNVIQFTQPYLIIEGTIMVPENSRIFSVKEIDHAGNVINVAIGAVYDLYLSRQIKRSTMQRYGSSKEAIDMFVNGQGDMVAGIRQVLINRVAADKRFRVLPDSFAEIQQSICVPCSQSSLSELISELLSKWHSQGEIKNLINEFIASK